MHLLKYDFSLSSEANQRQQNEQDSRNRMSGPDMSPESTRGTVLHLYRKTRRGTVPEPVPAGIVMTSVTGLGIVGDVHAHRLSPRQILVTSQHELEEQAIPPGALGENMVVALENPALFVPGAALVTSCGVAINLTMHCEPCEKIRSVAPDLKRMLRRRGILGYFAKGGDLSVGDTFTVVTGQSTPLPDSPLRRFQQFVALIPPGNVLRYLDVAIGMGAADSFVRAMPGYIRRSQHLGLPLHRIVTATGALPDLVPLQAEQLAAEGVRVERRTDAPSVGVATVNLQTCLWRG